MIHFLARFVEVSEKLLFFFAQPFQLPAQLPLRDPFWFLERAV